MTQTMIEKMARAMCLARVDPAMSPEQALSFADGNWRLNVVLAKSALTALLEPDAAMVAQLMPNEIPEDRLGFETTLAYWRFRTAIKVALGEPLKEGENT